MWHELLCHKVQVTAARQENEQLIQVATACSAHHTEDPRRAFKSSLKEASKDNDIFFSAVLAGL